MPEKIVKDSRQGKGKVVKVGSNPDSYIDTHPSWQINILDVGCKWNLLSLSKDDLCTIVFPRLRHFETMKWKEIIGPENHEISLKNIIPDAQKRLEKINQSDIDSLISLRINGKTRIWGIRVGSVVKLLWYDPEHEICPSPKKYT